MSGSGLVDTTTEPYGVGCEQHSGGTMTSTVAPIGPSKVVLTRVADVTTGTANGPTTLTPVLSRHAKRASLR